ncbi:hypothetical protein AVEN_189101-1 [Araneus ventricosus]|uniref:Uncharacterized protein n=1 Tax=Araneus ventricosus TaxID=182803 RepID=A0A4Y2HG69_ARAVE|nr:hypothetical protein AVEN_189101-1 [Araneus ventricosus]
MAPAPYCKFSERIRSDTFGENQAISWCCKANPVAISVCSKVAAVLLCKSAESLTRQDRKFETSFQKRRSHQASNLQRTFHVHCKRAEKREYAYEPWIRTPEISLTNLSP